MRAQQLCDIDQVHVTMWQAPAGHGVGAARRVSAQLLELDVARLKLVTYQTELRLPEGDASIPQWRPVSGVRIAAAEGIKYAPPVVLRRIHSRETAQRTAWQGCAQA